MDIDKKKEEVVPCATCDGVVEGVLEKVKLAVCCQKCCLKNLDDRERCRTSKAGAKSQFHCKEEDLLRLDCAFARNPVCRRFLPVKLYMRAEVEHLGKVRREKERRKKEEKDAIERVKLIKKKHNLLKKLHVGPGDMDVLLWPFLVGDYLQKSAGTKTKQRDVLKRFTVIRIVEDILQTCPRAHPGAAFDFCVEHPQEGRAEFQRMKNKIRMVFRLEGARILHNLSFQELKSLTGTPLEEDYAELKSCESSTVFREHLSARVGEKAAEEILRRPVIMQRINGQGLSFCAACELAEYWKEEYEREERKRELEIALDSRGLVLPRDCSYCRGYVHGRSDVNLDRVVAIVDLLDRLKNAHGIHPYGSKAGQGKKLLLSLFPRSELHYEDVVTEAVDRALIASSPKWHSTDSDDGYSDISY